MTTPCGFEIVRGQAIPELNCHATLYRHVRTGAELLAVTNDDENKAFGVAFRTLPPDDTGVPHILEHAVLGGSRKYPVKEPFVQLLKSSLATFINAMTFPDKTVYPVASQNLQDLYNLVDVYLDAVFDPLLLEETFQQEGWHHELDGPQAALAYRGVVFNEMKGAMARPEAVQAREAERVLFPDNAYGRASGGLPERIPDLTYEQFVAFYRTYYHPSNARFFLYGDLPVDEMLCRIDARLAGFERAEVPAGIALQAAPASAARVTAPYVAGALAATSPADRPRAYVTVSWVMGPQDDPVEVMSADILSYILTGSRASPLRKALVESGLGEDVTAVHLSGLRQIGFSSGLKGVTPENAARVEPLILETLEALARDGIDPEMVAAAMNTMEFGLRENDAFGGQRGISLMLFALATWLHDGDPFSLLAFEAPLAAVKANLAADPRYFEAMVRRCLLDNPHRVTVTLLPDPDLRSRQDAEERGRLERTRAALSDAEVAALVEQTAAFKAKQQQADSPEALATLPALRRSDLERIIRTIPLEEERHADVPVLVHGLPTNGIVYLDLGFNLRGLDPQDLPLLTVFGRALLEMGTERQDYARLAMRIGRETGGLHPSTYVSEAREGLAPPAYLFLRGKVMAPQAPQLLAILSDVLLTGRLDDRDRFRQIVLESKARRESSLLSRGNGFAAGRLAAHFTEAGWIDEQIGGVAGLQAVRDLADAVEHDWPSVLARLVRVRAALVRRAAIVANVTLEPDAQPAFMPALADLLASLPEGGVLRPASWAPPALPLREGFTVPSQVNYVGKAAVLHRAGRPLHGSVLAINAYLNTTWLWEKVRAQGGAYGAHGGLDLLSGLYTYTSYRDPNVLRTLDNYDGTPHFLRSLAPDDDEVTKAVIAATGKLDRHQLPAAKGFTSLSRVLTGRTDAWRQQLRDELLSTTSAHFGAFADALEEVARAGHVVALGSGQALQAAEAERPGLWGSVTALL